MEENKNELENEVPSTEVETAVPETEGAPEIVEPAPVPETEPAEIVETTVPETAGGERGAAPEEPKPKKDKKGLIIIVILLLILVAAAVYYFVFGPGSTKKENKESKGSTITEKEKKNSPYRLSGNGLEEFDLQFLKLANKNENVVYSPISIKYMLAMLNEGTAGESHEQIKSLIGDYKPSKYTNSQNLAFGNAFFIREDYASYINKDTTNLLQDKYNAEVKTGSFDDPALINNWINDKTLGLIKDLVKKEDLEGLDYIIANALGIDMEWTSNFLPKKNSKDISSNYTSFVSYQNTDFAWYNRDDVIPGKFNGSKKYYETLQVNASYNNYDVVKEHGGEENYKKDIENYYVEKCEYNKDVAEKLAETDYNTITKYYKQLDKTTDFYFYTDDDVKVFAKDLKEYDGVQLQYVGFEPQSQDLTTFVEGINASKLNNYINKLKPLEAESFEEGYVTYIKGTMPKFKYSYATMLKENLQSIGVTDIFDPNKADLSKLASGPSFIVMAKHSANIEFTEDGIKASAVTLGGGAGNAMSGCPPYTEKMKIKEIDLTFDKPYMYIVRNKATGEVWFAGSVVEPTDWTGYEINE